MPSLNELKPVLVELGEGINQSDTFCLAEQH